MIDPSAEIHPLAYIEDNVDIGANTKVGPFCIVRSGAKIGSNCKFTAYCEIRENVVSATELGLAAVAPFQPTLKSEMTSPSNMRLS